MRHISIRKIRTLIIVLFVLIVITLTFSALTSKKSYTEDPSFVDSIGTEKEIKENVDTGILEDDVDFMKNDKENLLDNDDLNQDFNEFAIDNSIAEYDKTEKENQDDDINYDDNTDENEKNIIEDDKNDMKQFDEEKNLDNDNNLDGDDDDDDDYNNHIKNIKEDDKKEIDENANKNTNIDDDNNLDDDNTFNDNNAIDDDDDTLNVNKNINKGNIDDNDNNIDDDNIDGDDNEMGDKDEGLYDDKKEKDNDNNLDDDDNVSEKKQNKDDDGDDDGPMDGMGDKNDESMDDINNDPDDNNNIDEDENKNNNSDDDEKNIDNDNNIDEINEKDHHENDDDHDHDENEIDPDNVADENNLDNDKDEVEDKNDEEDNIKNKYEIKPDSMLGSKTKFKLFHRGSNYRDSDDPTGTKCPVAWEWIESQEESDIIAMNPLDNYSQINRIESFDYDKSRQKLLLMSMESTSNYEFMLTKKKSFDYFIDYRLDSDVPIPYTYDFFNFLKPALPTKEKGKDGRGLAAVFISNCNAVNERLEFLKQLMEYTKIDSFGMCAHNKEVYDEDSDRDSWQTKMNTISKYKFTLAFENSNDRDYVTEKFFQPLEAGSVPVFFGTSNIADFAPEHSFINANDFESAKELAEYLEMLDKDDKEYESYLEWKKKGEIGENLEHLIEIRKFNSICQLLQRIKGLWINPYLTIWDRKDVSKGERACGLC
ncbi:hypothetical protein BCR36DRAFT_582853 [Piromyces finnis]|uniref:Fucosyltransferase n=1 Tax=Piromyces finnis TaxID=1754191 RepID=A0A1Y1VC30_9FUNG|nr:hypothetical protein BCR36DRAFT_582853 [Piromyces finnis]|eukprot:ORX51816.1 hypothetical protein BCR36DRAFT_582853 [Piromyces finnis]